MKVKKEDREKNAKMFYELALNSYTNKSAIVISRDRKSGKTQFLAAPSGLCNAEKPIVIAESKEYGVEGCFIEFIEFIRGGRQVTYYEEGFDKWFESAIGLEILYEDYLVIVFGRKLVS